MISGKVYLLFVTCTDGCPVEISTNCSNVAAITWPETEIGEVASVRCPCGPDDQNPLPPQSVATRRCAGNYGDGARWENPSCAPCQFTDSRLTLCSLLEVRVYVCMCIHVRIGMYGTYMCVVY